MTGYTGRKEVHGDNELHAAVGRQEDVNKIRKLIGKFDIDAPTSLTQLTALHLAARKSDNKETVNLLLRKGANPDAKDKIGNTPLHWAVRHGQIETIELLLAGNADPNARNNQGETPLHHAIQWLPGWKLGKLGQQGPFPHGTIPMMELLLRAGADPNTYNKQGKTPLHSIVVVWDTWKIASPVAQLLLEKGADANLKDRQGNTPLFLHLERSEYDRRTIGAGGPWPDLVKALVLVTKDLTNILTTYGDSAQDHVKEIFFQEIWNRGSRIGCALGGCRGGCTRCHRIKRAIQILLHADMEIIDILIEDADGRGTLWHWKAPTTENEPTSFTRRRPPAQALQNHLLANPRDIVTIIVRSRGQKEWKFTGNSEQLVMSVEDLLPQEHTDAGDGGDEESREMRKRRTPQVDTDGEDTKLPTRKEKKYRRSSSSTYQQHAKDHQ